MQTLDNDGLDRQLAASLVNHWIKREQDATWLGPVSRTQQLTDAETNEKDWYLVIDRPGEDDDDLVAVADVVAVLRQTPEKTQTPISPDVVSEVVLPHFPAVSINRDPSAPFAKVTLTWQDALPDMPPEFSHRLDTFDALRYEIQYRPVLPNDSADWTMLTSTVSSNLPYVSLAPGLPAVGPHRADVTNLLPGITYEFDLRYYKPGPSPDWGVSVRPRITTETVQAVGNLAISYLTSIQSVQANNPFTALALTWSVPSAGASMLNLRILNDIGQEMAQIPVTTAQPYYLTNMTPGTTIRREAQLVVKAGAVPPGFVIDDTGPLYGPKTPTVPATITLPELPLPASILAVPYTALPSTPSPSNPLTPYTALKLTWTQATAVPAQATIRFSGANVVGTDVALTVKINGQTVPVTVATGASAQQAASAVLTALNGTAGLNVTAVVDPQDATRILINSGKAGYLGNVDTLSAQMVSAGSGLILTSTSFSGGLAPYMPGMAINVRLYTGNSTTPSAAQEFNGTPLPLTGNVISLNPGNTYRYTAQYQIPPYATGREKAAANTVTLADKPVLPVFDFAVDNTEIEAALPTTTARLYFGGTSAGGVVIFNGTVLTTRIYAGYTTLSKVVPTLTSTGLSTATSGQTYDVPNLSLYTTYYFYVSLGATDPWLGPITGTPKIKSLKTVPRHFPEMDLDIVASSDSILVKVPNGFPIGLAAIVTCDLYGDTTSTQVFSGNLTAGGVAHTIINRVKGATYTVKYHYVVTGSVSSLPGPNVAGVSGPTHTVNVLIDPPRLTSIQVNRDFWYQQTAHGEYMGWNPFTMSLFCQNPLTGVAKANSRIKVGIGADITEALAALKSNSYRAVGVTNTPTGATGPIFMAQGHFESAWGAASMLIGDANTDGLKLKPDTAYTIAVALEVRNAGDTALTKISGSTSDYLVATFQSGMSNEIGWSTKLKNGSPTLEAVQWYDISNWTVEKDWWDGSATTLTVSDAYRTGETVWYEVGMAINALVSKSQLMFSEIYVSLDSLKIVNNFFSQCYLVNGPAYSLNAAFKLYQSGFFGKSRTGYVSKIRKLTAYPGYNYVDVQTYEGTHY